MNGGSAGLIRLFRVRVYLNSARNSEVPPQKGSEGERKSHKTCGQAFFTGIHISL